MLNLTVWVPDKKLGGHINQEEVSIIVRTAATTL